jgi:tryptophanyl-tRNA synthetase
MEKKKICLTGIKPTGMPHLGNYLGAIKPAIDMANSGEFDGYYFIADYHSLTSVHKGADLKKYIYEIAATWLALGLDPEKTCLYQQSHIPEIMEMNWILSCFTAKGLMNRAHAYKASVAVNEEKGKDVDHGINMGVYTYPILMSADILFLKSEIVPVGADQVQHVEIARDIANAFNHHYGNIFTLPEAKAEKESMLIPGLDGRKMSKSYDNTIPLFVSSKKQRKLINKIKTDSSEPSVPKNPDDSLIFDLYKQFANEEQIKDLREWYLRGIGWGEAKAELHKVIDAHLEGPRAIYDDLMANPHKIDKILEDGAAKVRPKAQQLLQEVKAAIGVV